MKIGCLILSLFFFPIWMQGQYHLSHVDIEDGLVQNSITEIFQDSEGYIWFSTQDGVSRYDGYQFRNYNISNRDSLSLSDNFLWGFAEDSLGYIWICSRDGLNRLNKQSGETIHFFKDKNASNLTPNQAEDVAIVNGKVYVIYGSDVFRFPVKENYPNKQMNVGKPISFPNDSVFARSLCVDPTSRQLYIFHTRGVLALNEKHSILLHPEDPEKTQEASQAVYHQSKFWFTDKKQLWSYDPQRLEFKPFSYSFGNLIITAFCFYKDELWVGTNGGLFIFQDGKLIRHMVADQNTPDAIHSDFVSALYPDPTGKIWIGTGDRGVHLYDPQKARFGYWSKEIFGEDPSIRSIFQINKKTWLVGTNNGLMKVKNPEKKVNATIRKISVNHQENAIVTCIRRTKPNRILLAVRRQGIAVVDSNLNVLKTVVLNPTYQNTNRVSEMIVRKSGEIWVFTHFGIYVLSEEFDLVKQYWHSKKGLSTSYFLSAYESESGRLWMGTNVGFFLYEDDHDQFTQYPYIKNKPGRSPGFNFIAGFHEFGDGNLWVATYGGGLSKMNIRTGEFNQYTSENGLINNVCNGILVDANQKIWLSTNRGISQFDPSTEKFLNFTTEDGLRFNEFNLGVYHQSPDRHFAFGTPVGLVIFKPEHIHQSNYQPAVVVHQLDINYKNQSHRMKTEPLHLYPKDKAVTFRFAALNYSKSTHIRYQYILEGYSPDWVETTDPTAGYTSLPPGSYVFKIKATNADGVWSPLVKEIPFIVHPPFYQTWWFRMISLLLIMAIIIGIIRYFAQRKMKKKLLEMSIQQEVYLEKQRISRDLHDNLGAQITYLISSIDQESYQAGEKDSLEELGDKARNVMAHLRQSIWVLNKESIGLKEFVDKITDYTSRVFTPAEIKCQTSFKGDPELHIPPAVVNHVFRITQEAINNIIKHSKAKQVQIMVDTLDGNLKLSILDDGIGIKDPMKSDHHFGLKNMQDRTRELHGEFRIKSHESKPGTLITVHVPLTELNE